jgi:orotidine-5'-phosphate decarboxylase
MDQLLIALDVGTAAKAIRLAGSLRGIAGGFKIGSRLFTAEGPGVVRELVEKGDRVFLDLKFHDIPNTVAQAVAAATSLGVWMVNVHACGGTQMMQAARDAARETAARAGTTPPLVIAVTVLTSMDGAALSEVGCGSNVGQQVERLAGLASNAGLRGLVCSPLEIVALRQLLPSNVQLVTPGIRGSTEKADDQKRWTNYTLNQEEQYREFTRSFEGVNEKLVEFKESIQLIEDLTRKLDEQIEKRLQGLMALARDWLAEYERALGRSR